MCVCACEHIHTLHAFVRARVHVCLHLLTHAHSDRLVGAGRHMHPHTHLHSHSHARTHAHTTHATQHTHTHTHTRTTFIWVNLSVSCLFQKFMFFVLKSSDVLDILVPILYNLNDARADQCRFCVLVLWGYSCRPVLQ